MIADSKHHPFVLDRARLVHGAEAQTLDASTFGFGQRRLEAQLGSFQSS